MWARGRDEGYEGDDAGEEPRADADPSEEEGHAEGGEGRGRRLWDRLAHR